MSSSLPDGATIRPATEADADAIAQVLRAAERAVRGKSTVTASDVRGWMRLVKLPEASWLVERDGELVATGISIEHGGAMEFNASVHPDHLGRGYSTALLEIAEADALAKGYARLRAGAMAEEAAANELLQRRGYRDVRHFYTMRIDFGEPPPTPSWPEGVRGGTMGPEEAQQFHATLNDAFQEEWGWVPMPFDEWRALRLDPPDVDPSLYFVARAGGELAAAARCEKLLGAGWVGAIGVRKPWRGRGVGLALLRHAFARFYERGERTVRLGVDAENPTGATRLYERAGMRVEAEQIVYEKEPG